MASIHFQLDGADAFAPGPFQNDSMVNFQSHVIRPMNFQDKKALVEKIATLSIEAHLEIFFLLRKFSTQYTSTRNGVFFNLNAFPDFVLRELVNMVNFCTENEVNLNLTQKDKRDILLYRPGGPVPMPPTGGAEQKQEVKAEQKKVEKTQESEEETSSESESESSSEEETDESESSSESESESEPETEKKPKLTEVPDMNQLIGSGKRFNGSRARVLMNMKNQNQVPEKKQTKKTSKKKSIKAKTSKK
jgi:hypothetical protein